MSPDSKPRRYTVEIGREDNLWVAVVRDLPGGVTDVERFDELDVEVRDLIYLLTDEPEGSFGIDWHYVQGERDYTRAVEDLHRWEEQTAEAIANRDRARLEIIRTMKASGLSQRAIAEVIGTSHQRVGQLMAEAG